MTRSVLILTMCLAVGAVAAGRTQAVTLPPDVAATRPTLRTARACLLDAARDEQLEDLLPCLRTGGIRYNHYSQDYYTPEEFIAFLRCWPAEDLSRFWRNVRDALRLPMAPADENVVYAPWVGALTSDPEWDQAQVVITSAGVRLRAAPSPTADIVEILPLGIVRLVMMQGPQYDERHPMLIDGAPFGWRHVVSRTGREGWVSARHARDAESFPIEFHQELDGTWVLVAFHNGYQ